LGLLALCILTASGCAADSSDRLDQARAPVTPSPGRHDAGAGSYLLITDLDASAESPASLQLLLGTGLTVLSPGAATAEALATAGDGVVVLLTKPDAIKGLAESLRRYAADGGTVVLDTASFGAMNQLAVRPVAADRVRIVRPAEVTSGLRVDDRLTLRGRDGLQALPEIKESKELRVLAIAEPGGEPVLVEQSVGRGRLVATDLRTPAEPYVWDAGSFYKYLFVANAIGNPVRFGSLWASKPTYAELVSQMQALARQYPKITFAREGPSTGSADVCSLSIGDPGKPGLLILGAVHGNEWENGPGLLTFMRRVAEGRPDLGFDPAQVHLKVVPVMSPWGFDHVSRLNGHGVNLNRNGDVGWDAYRAADTNGDGAYGPQDQDWKGAAPFGEPESQTLVRVLQAGNFQAVLDIHSNPSGTGYNKTMAIRSPDTPGAREMAKAFSEQFNRQIVGRYVLRQQHEKTVRAIVNERLGEYSSGPTLGGSTLVTQGRHSMLVELPGGIWVSENADRSAYGTLLATDLVCELCAAFVKTYGTAPPSTGQGSPAQGDAAP